MCVCLCVCVCVCIYIHTHIHRHISTQHVHNMFFIINFLEENEVWLVADLYGHGFESNPILSCLIRTHQHVQRSAGVLIIQGCMDIP